VAELQTALDRPDIRVEAMEVLRTLIERIVLPPDETAPNGLAVELFGDLATILNLTSATGPALAQSAGGRTSKNPRAAGVFGSTLSVVAGPAAAFVLTTGFGGFPPFPAVSSIAINSPRRLACEGSH